MFAMFVGAEFAEQVVAACQRFADPLHGSVGGFRHADVEGRGGASRPYGMVACGQSFRKSRCIDLPLARAMHEPRWTCQNGDNRSAPHRSTGSAIAITVNPPTNGTANLYGGSNGTEGRGARRMRRTVLSTCRRRRTIATIFLPSSSKCHATLIRVPRIYSGDVCSGDAPSLVPLRFFLLRD